MTVKAILKGRPPFVTSKRAPPTAISLTLFIYTKQEEQREAGNRYSQAKFTINNLLNDFLKAPK
jgi:hypothetical protein